jgi:hypothetical protein
MINIIICILNIIIFIIIKSTKIKNIIICVINIMIFIIINIITVYLDIKYGELEQCNDKVVLIIESCKDCRGMVWLSFHWDAFGIERMVWQKIVCANFGGAWWGCKHLALGLSCPVH